MANLGFVAAIKAIALTSAGLFAGYTWALSDAAVPTILIAPEAVIAAQWRKQYLKGFYISRPMCLINGLGFGYLAFIAPAESLLRWLYIVAAATTASGVPYALTFLRKTNGALSIRAEKLAGKGTGEIALTYAVRDKAAIEREQTWTTEKMVRRWQWHNAVRTWVLVLGTFVGSLAVALDS